MSSLPTIFEYLPQGAEGILKCAKVEEVRGSHPIWKALKVVGASGLGAGTGYFGGRLLAGALRKKGLPPRGMIPYLTAGLGMAAGYAATRHKTKSDEEVDRAVEEHRNRAAGRSSE